MDSLKPDAESSLDWTACTSCLDCSCSFWMLVDAFKLVAVCLCFSHLCTQVHGLCCSSKCMNFVLSISFCCLVAQDQHSSHLKYPSSFESCHHWRHHYCSNRLDFADFGLNLNDSNCCIYFELVDTHLGFFFWSHYIASASA